MSVKSKVPLAVGSGITSVIGTSCTQAPATLRSTTQPTQSAGGSISALLKVTASWTSPPTHSAVALTAPQNSWAPAPAAASSSTAVNTVVHSLIIIRSPDR